VTTARASTPPAPRRKRWRWALATVAFAMWWVAGFGGALLVTMPRNVPVAARAEVAGRALENVATTASDGVTTRGWLVRAAPDSTRCVVFAAGIRGNRAAMLERAEWYLANGWCTLLVDLRGTGESDAARITMGWNESLDLLAWRELLRTRGFTTVGAHGQSLGAAAVVYSAARSMDASRWDFVVLESCYRDIEAALAARLPWLPFANALTWPMSCCAEWLTGVSGTSLRPVDAIRSLDAPTLLLCGASDTKVGERATDDLLGSSPARDKRAVVVDGIGHVDLWRAAGERVRAELASFLASR